MIRPYANMSAAQKVLAALAGVAFLVTGQANAQTLDASVDNGVVKAGVGRAYGGAIVWLSANGGGNLVNNADKGRQIQQSYYAGHSVTSTNQCPAWSPWPWNPILAGDCGGNASPVLTLTSSAGQIYVKSQPRLWDRHANSLAQAYIEQWISLHTSLSNVVIVDCTLTCFRGTNDEWGVAGAEDQELPACYFVACLNTIMSYTGGSPWQNGALSTIPNTPSSGTFPWTRYTATEQWSACVNSSSSGAGVYTPVSTGSLAGKAGSSTTCNTSDGSTMYIAPLGQYAFNWTSTFSYRYYLIVGALSNIRSTVYTLHSAPPLPTGLTAIAGIGQVSLTWNAAADVASYTVLRSTVNNGPYTTNATGLTSPNYIDTGLTNGTTYYYVVSCVNGLGESPNSIQASATPLCNISTYSVTGGGAYCAGGLGMPVGLVNSDSGVDYQLQLNGGASGVVVPGTTGQPITFGNQTAVGTYTVLATNAAAGCSANMSGSVRVTVNQPSVAGNNLWVTTQNYPVSVPETNLLQNASSPNANPVYNFTGLGLTPGTGSISSLSGATVATTENKLIIYTPPSDSSVTSDLFTYNFTDGYCTAVGTVNVAITPSSGSPPQLNNVAIQGISTCVDVAYYGQANATYQFQFSPTIGAAASWVPVGDPQTTGPSPTVLYFADCANSAQTLPGGYYRVVCTSCP